MKRILDMCGALAWKLLSVPIFVKVIGIGAIVAVIFGAVTLYTTQQAVEGFRLEMLELRLAATARPLARDLESATESLSQASLQTLLDAALHEHPGIRYVVVRDDQGSVAGQALAAAFPTHAVPRLPGYPPRAGASRRVLTEDGGLVTYGMALARGPFGTLEIGMRDHGFWAQESAMRRSVLSGLAFSIGLGISLAFLLTHLLTFPIYHLQDTARRIGAGEVGARAKVFNEDEIGDLAVTVNLMAQNLEDYRKEVEEKETVRKSLVEKTVRAAEEERTHVARELHDQLGQSLSITLLKLQMIAANSEADEALCHEIESEIRNLVDEVRRLARDLRPPILDDYGLDHALNRHVNQVAGQLGIPIDFRSVGVGSPEFERLPEPIEITLYRIAQEALTNVVRHAEATRASVVLVSKEDEVSLVVEDDGKGFDVAALGKGSVNSLGLVGMRERAEFVGGEVEFESEPGKGTAVYVRVPR